MARICMVAYTHYPTDSRVRREAEALVDRGDSVDVICLGKNNDERVRVLNGVRLIQLSVVRYRGSSAIMYLVNYFLFFTSASISLTHLHLKNRYQIIQVHTMPDFMVFVAMIPKLLGAHVILDVHDLMPELYQSKFGLDETHWLIRLITWMERCSIGFADKAIAVHTPHLDTLICHGNPAGKFIILLNLPDPKIFANRSRVNCRNDSGFKLIYHGMVAERHGLKVAVWAVSRVRRDIQGLEFKIVGEGDGIPGLIELVNELGLTDCIEISKGYVPMEELVPIILDADVGIVPILNDAFTRYMLPVKLLEYIALGKPVICSRTATIEAYFDDSMVQYSRCGDAAELAEHIRVLYCNPDKREQLRANADKFNREYNWERQKQFYYELVDGLIRKQ
ncbi:MAG TPA: glycosyltransferase family 4 protein [Sedimentisphaerales bacterium]|nr:glycosyltransferase family 4 protein [Sedimentisphaerales bacterium]